MNLTQGTIEAAINIVGSILGVNTMLLALGDFRFSINTAAPSEIAHSRAWEWVENEVIQQNPTLQYTGPKPEQITLRGTVYPLYYGSTREMDYIADMAAQGQPLLMVNGVGRVLGYWVVAAIDENKFDFVDNGQPKKIEFSITLKKYGDTL